MSEDGDPARTPTRGAGGEDDPRKGTLLVSLFSGTGAALVTAIAAVIIASSSNNDAGSVRTVPGPTRTVTQTVTKIVRVGKQGEPCSGTRVTNDPPYEPNDLVAQAYGPIRSEQPLEATLESYDDVDFFALCVGRPAVIHVKVRQTGCRSTNEGGSTFCDLIKLRLLDDGGSILRESEVNDDVTVGTLTKRVGRGRFYVRLSEGDGFRYELSINAGTVPLRSYVPAASP
jgi:hypothetical protein